MVETKSLPLSSQNPQTPKPENVPAIPETAQPPKTTLPFSLSLLFILMLSLIYLLLTRKNTALPESNAPLIVPSLSPKKLSPTPTISQILHFQSKELGVSFDYRSDLGTPKESPVLKGSEKWWRIQFSQISFDAGTFEISSATPLFKPKSWTGTPLWVNSKISASDSINSISNTLTTEGYKVLKIEKINKESLLPAFKVWVLNCYIGCKLSRIYLIPISKDKYNTLVLFATMNDLDMETQKGSVTIAKTRALAEIQKIESKKTDITTQKYLDWQDLMFNSLAPGSAEKQ